MTNMPLWWGVLIAEVAAHVWDLGPGSIWEFSVLSAQLAVNLKLL